MRHNTKGECSQLDTCSKHENDAVHKLASERLRDVLSARKHKQNEAVAHNKPQTDMAKV
jgi:hypothetical protein